MAGFIFQAIKFAASIIAAEAGRRAVKKIFDIGIEKYQTKITTLNKAASFPNIKNLPTYNVHWIIDGDSIIAEKNSQKIKMRLDAIDAPEQTQPHGDNAKYALMKLLDNNKVHFEIHGLDKFGRTIATLYVRNKNEWQNINEKMIMLGNAWVMHSHINHLPSARQKKLKDLQRWARAKKIGLWKNDSAIPPWQWRAENN